MPVALPLPRTSGRSGRTPVVGGRHGSRGAAPAGAPSRDESGHEEKLMASQPLPRVTPAVDLVTVSDMWAMYIDGLGRAAGLADLRQLMLAGTSMPAQLGTETQSSPPVTTAQALSQ